MTAISRTKAYKAAYWQQWTAKNRPPVIAYCEICGKVFKRHGPQKRCDDCRHIQCEQCGKLFIPSNSTLNHRFCSRDCKGLFQTGAEPEHLKLHRGVKPRTYHLRHRDKHGNAFDREWRKEVFERDDYTCQDCGKRGQRLQAHHIKPYKKYPELRWDLNNGITLCVECHKKTDTYGWQNYWKSQTAVRRLQQGVFLWGANE